jgi:hypothetical protein
VLLNSQEEDEDEEDKSEEMGEGEDTDDDEDDEEERLINLITRMQYRQVETIVGDQGTVEYGVVCYTVLLTFSTSP